jgi:hypothetical protein
MLPEEKKFGVDLIKKAIKFLYDTTLEVVGDLKDKKFSLGEILGLGDNVYTGISIGMKSGELWSEITDVDTEEGAELAVYVGELVKGATSEQVGIIVTNAVEAIQAEIAVYEKNIVPIIEIIKESKKKAA